MQWFKVPESMRDAPGSRLELIKVVMLPARYVDASLTTDADGAFEGTVVPHKLDSATNEDY